VDDRFGGLSLGPGIQLGAAYRPDPASRTFVTAAMRKLWAGSTSRWSVQVGMRLVFPPRSGSHTGPFAMPRPGAVTAGAAAPDTALRPDPAAVPGPAIQPPPADTTVAGLAARVEALEGRLREEASARERAEAEARSLRLRADSLAAATQAAAAFRERAAAAEQDRRDTLFEALRGRAGGGRAITAVEEAEGSIRIVLGGSLFPVGATDVATAAAADVRGLGAVLAGHPGATIAVEGHTDDTGAEDANLTISRLRAEAVRSLLMEGGVAAAAVTATGRGEVQPVADNGTREGRARNRRVEVSVRLVPAER